MIFMESTTAFLLRAAEPRDVDAIVGLITELAAFEQLTHLLRVTPDKLRAQLFGDRPAAEAVVAEIGSEVVAFALFFTNFSTFLAQPGLYLEDLYVKPDYRGRGIGEAVLKYLGRLAVERGYGRFEWSVLDWNDPAIGFYESLGAEAQSEWIGYRLSGEALARLAAG
jgi:ribosomal protein S18 acetylase RimI-like enzyme